MPTAVIAENNRMCGTGVVAPIMNANAFVADVIVIDGPTSDNALPRRDFPEQ